MTGTPLNLPTEPTEYVGLTRGPLRAWWRPLFSLLLLLLAALLLAVPVLLLALGIALARGLPAISLVDQFSVFTNGALGLAMNSLTLALGIPAVILATSLGQRLPCGFVHSVAGRFRWDWFARITLCLLPVFVLSIGTIRVVNFTGVHPEPDWVWLILVALLLTPFQTAGEEYVFRGWLLQNVGGWFRTRCLAWGVPVVLSTAFFSLLHGSLDPWVLLDLIIFTLATMLVIWRTGGIEAAIAMHVLNNVLVLASGAVLGGVRASLVTQQSTAGWDLALGALITQGLAVAVVFWAARRFGIRRFSDPRGLGSVGDPGVRLGERAG